MLCLEITWCCIGCQGGSETVENETLPLFCSVGSLGVHSAPLPHLIPWVARWICVTKFLISEVVLNPQPVQVSWYLQLGSDPGHRIRVQR